MLTLGEDAADDDAVVVAMAMAMAMVMGLEMDMGSMMTMAKLRHYFIICYVNLRAAKVCVKYFGFDFEVAPAEAEVEAEVPSSQFPVPSFKLQVPSRYSYPLGQD